MIRAAVVAAFLATSALAQNADLTLKLSVDARYNAGEIGTLHATVTNLGPDTATAAGVRLTKPSNHFANAPQFGCLEFPDSILCNVPTLAKGESHEFVVPFVPPDDAGTLQLNAHTESFSLDPNHDNDAASATTEVVKLADVSIEASAFPSLAVGKPSKVFVVVRQKAALRADPVTIFATFPEPLTVDDTSSTCTNVDATTLRCTVKTFGNDISTYFEVVPTRIAEPVMISLSVESSEPDWNPANNRTSLTLPIYNVPDLIVKIDAPATLDDSNRTTVRYTFTNATDVPATNVQAEIITFPGNPDAVVPSDWSCHPSTLYRLQCTNPLIAPHSTSTLNVNVQFDRKYLRTTLATNVTQKPAADASFPTQSLFVDAVFYKRFGVTSLADSGAGTLRQTILDTNAECSTGDGNPPCEIVFGVSGTIAPLSALPLVTVTDFAIDGDARIVLDGSNAGAANGLYLFNAGAVVHGLSIHNFAQNAILSISHINAFLTRHHVIDHNDLSGNGLRGVMAYGYEGEITDNVLHDNGRSAIFLTDRSSATITGNDIDRNGASGIYLGGSSAVVEHNTIADERDFGIAIDRSATAQIFENKIVHNAQPGIDIGLDGPTLKSTPVITSARFDPPTGQTIIDGTIPLVGGSYPVTETAYVYANTTDEAGGETFLGSVQADKSGHFTLRYSADLTGKFIDASAYIVIDFGDFISRSSTEFGNRTPVER